MREKQKKRHPHGTRTGLCLLMAFVMFGGMGSIGGRAEREGGDGETAWQDLGQIASQYLEQMAGQYKNRTAGSDAKIRAGEWIAGEMAAMGYQVEIMPFDQGGYHFVNYIGTKTGQGDGIVYLGAHYDSVDTTGTDDNASGVAVLLETAKRLAAEETEHTLKFCFFDGEESALTGIGYAGSCYYTAVKREEAPQAVCYINVDCVAAGDALFAYGGAYGETGELTRREGYDWAHRAADELGISLRSLPEQVEQFASPTRVTGSDQHYFNADWEIPYVYFEASRWCEEDGSGGNEQTNKTCWYQTNDPRLSWSGGRVMHMAPLDDLTVLEAYFPGRVQNHLADTVAILTHMVENPHLRFLPWTKTDEANEAEGREEEENRQSGGASERAWEHFPWVLCPRMPRPWGSL